MEPTELHAKFELIIYNGLVRGVNTEKYINKKYKITTCASVNAIGVTISEVNWDQ